MSNGAWHRFLVQIDRAGGGRRLVSQIPVDTFGVAVFAMCAHGKVPAVASEGNGASEQFVRVRIRRFHLLDERSLRSGFGPVFIQ